MKYFKFLIKFIIIVFIAKFLIGLFLDPPIKIKSGYHSLKDLKHIKHNISTENRLNLDVLKEKGIHYYIQDLPDEMVYALQNGEYSQYYNSNKRFVQYYTGGKCPYGQVFIDTFPKVINKYSNEYNVLTVNTNQVQSKSNAFTCNSKKECKEKFKIIDLNEDFSLKYCMDFCIVNQNRQQVFSLFGVGSVEANSLEEIFEKLEAW